MSRDQDIKLGRIDDLSVDDAAPPRRDIPASSGAAARGKTPAPKQRNKAPGQTRRPPSSGGGWMYATALLAVIVVVTSAYFFHEMQSMKVVLDSQLDKSSQQLGNLASQLSATDESLSQSSGKLTQTVANHDSEIRKLWDVSNKRNKEWIKKNEADIDKVEKQRAAMNKSIAALQGDIDALKKQSQQYQMQRNQMQTQLDLASESVRQAEATVAAQKKIVDQVSTMLPQLKSLAAVQGQGDGLSTRLADIEAAIKAFDAYRVEVNNRLDRMQGISHP